MTNPSESTPAVNGVLRTRLFALTALLLTFVAGAAVGWGIPHWHRGGPGPGGGGRGGPGGPGGHMFERLNLSPAQRTSVDSIFEARRQQIDEFWHGPGLRLQEILDSTNGDVRALLDSTQRVAYDKMRRRGPGGRRGPLPPPPGPPPRD